MLTNNIEMLRLVAPLLRAREALDAAVAVAVEARAKEIGERLMDAMSRVEEVCAELDLPNDDWPEPTRYTAREHRLLLENDHGTCPVCGRLRGFSVPDDCADNIACPEPEELERMLQQP